MTFATVFDRVATVVLAGAVLYIASVDRSLSGPPDDEVVIGTPAPPIAGATYSSAEKTLILSLRTTCPFCTDSMPFYRQVVASRSALARPFKVVAVSTEATKALADYIAQFNVTVDLVAQVDATSWREFLRTPTALVVDANGVIIGRWTGLLHAPRQKEVLGALGLR